METRPELTEMPDRIARLPVDHRGYPVPWFVAWLKDGEPQPRGVGEPEFRVVLEGTNLEAHKFNQCWICGQTLGVYRSFVIGPMCAVNRTSAEPPSHVDCATWAAINCPFLSRPHMVRREGNLPEGSHDADGIMLKRNPGVILTWTTTRYKLRPSTDEVLFWIGYPENVTFYAEGRIATRAEIMESITTGLPFLREVADEEGGRAPAELEKQIADALELVPA